MSSRQGSRRNVVHGLTAILLAVAPVAVWAASGQGGVRQEPSRSPEDQGGNRTAFAAKETSTRERPALYPRTEGFWERNAGPTYGFVPARESRNPDVILLRVGSFVTSGPGLSLPNDLRTPGVPAGRSYYIVQFTADAFRPERLLTSLETLKAAQADLIDYLPNNASIVRLDAAI